jgi:hypothetical protein
VLIGDPSLPATEFDRGGYFTRFSYDKLDSIFFPRHGQQFDIEWSAQRENIGADSDFDIVRTSWLIARSFDRHTFIFWTDEGTTVDALATPENSFTARRLSESLGADARLPVGAALRNRPTHLLPPGGARRLGRARSARVCGRFGGGR